MLSVCLVPRESPHSHLRKMLHFDQIINSRCTQCFSCILPSSSVDGVRPFVLEVNTSTTQLMRTKLARETSSGGF